MLNAYVDKRSDDGNARSGYAIDSGSTFLDLISFGQIRCLGCSFDAQILVYVLQHFFYFFLLGLESVFGFWN